MKNQINSIDKKDELTMGNLNIDFIYNKHMQSLKIIIWLSIFCFLAQSITSEFSQLYHLHSSGTAKYTFKLQQSSQLTVVQYRGKVEVTIFNAQHQPILKTTDVVYQNKIDKKYESQELTISVQAGSHSAVGSIRIDIAHPYEMILPGEEKFIHLKKRENRMIEIHPRHKGKLTIERFDGIPSFTNNRCLKSQKKQCGDQMFRLASQDMKKHIEVVELTACTNCLFLIHVTTNSAETRLRFSVSATRTIIEEYPTLSLIEKDEVVKFNAYGEYKEIGKILFYYGSGLLQSESTKINNFAFGYEYSRSQQVNKSQIQQANKSQIFASFALQLKGTAKSNYFNIQSPQSYQNGITLKDGFPSTTWIQPHKNYTFIYQNQNKGKGNIILSAPSQFMSRLSIKFTNKLTNQNYIVRPKYLFDLSLATQNFQLDQTQHDITIQLHLTEGKPGFLNISANVQQLIILPMLLQYSNILQHNQLDQYIIEGTNEPVQITVTKCADCTLFIYVGEEYNNGFMGFAVNQITNRLVFQAKSKQFYVRISTDNYAFYSIVVKHDRGQKYPKLQSEIVNFYLTEENGEDLIIQFMEPQCGQSACKNVTYYLLQGSNSIHLASKVYCSQNLFDFDERTKDFVVEVVKPTLNEKILSLTRPMKHRDYMGIVVKINESILLPYRVISTEQVKLYKQMRWPFFYLSLFVTAAILFSFILFMGLRRKNYYSSGGYVRVSAATSLDDIS